jgi:WS/DGAT/MGAT family acyltransferase
MARYAYERLSAESASFLSLESSSWFAHSATTLIFDAGPLGHPDGGVDFEAIRRGIESRLHLTPRFRQKLKWVPIERHPVWEDDHDFNLDYHLRHTSLPRPGGMDQLLKMSARIKAQRLDRSRPLWECWVLEGMEGDRFAVILKTHHALVDPASGEELLQALLSPEVDTPEPEAPPYRPRPVPSEFELVMDEIVRQFRLPRQALARLRSFAGETEHLRHDLEMRARALARMLGYTIRPPLETPLNGRVGPHRRFAHMVVPLEDAIRVHRELGGTVNDVILATVAGAVRSFLQERLVNPATLDFRVGAPVTVPSDGPRDHVDEWILELPVWEPDPVQRLAKVHEATQALNESAPARGARTLFSVAKWTGSRWLALGARAVSSRLPVNMTVVNVPGPQVPLYFLGARLQETYGQAPLRDNTALGVTVFSYDGKLCWGLNADFDLLPDLDRFNAALERAFHELLHAAGQHDPQLVLVS